MTTNARSKEAILRSIYKKHYSKGPGDYTTAEEFSEEVCKKFGWDTHQAYIATEFLFRPENNN